jgi:hypothetical protein
MNTRRLTPVVAALFLAAVPLAGAGASAPMSPDQRWVSELKSARQANQVVLRQLAPSSVSIGRANILAVLRVSVFHLKKAVQAAPETIGAADATIAESVSKATALTGQASSDVKKANYGGARKNLGLAIAAIGDALAKFGVPLASEFKVFGGYRELANIEGWQEYLGLTAKAPGVVISRVVIGLAGRETANAAEPGGRRAAPSLPITKLAVYTLQEPSGIWRSGWGKLVNGIIVCELKPTMDADETFAISFGPRVAKGTKFLVKLWSTDGRRSYSVVTTR